MKVSIITATYNSSKYLEDCIKSIIIQNYPNIEYIIIDGQSTDGTLDIIKKYESGIAYWISEPDKGMYDAINKGIRQATGDVIGILNSDDMLASPEIISVIANAFVENNVDSIYGDLAYVDKESTSRIIRFWRGSIYKRARFLYGWMPAHPTFYVKKSVIVQYGGYEKHYQTAADYEFMSRLLYRYRVSSYYIPRLIVKMRVGGASNITLKARLRANRRDYLAMKKNRIPFPLIVSILKPISKLHQYFYTLYSNKIL